MREREVIERLRRIATSPEARGLLDDVAVLGRIERVAGQAVA